MSPSPLSPPAVTQRPQSKSPSRRSILEQDTTRDLSFLLQPNNFAPIPPPVFAGPEPETKQHAALLPLVQQGRFNTAANLCAQLLINLPDASDTDLIMELWYVRLACLTLIHQTRTAAAESKVLGDLTSAFYRDNNNDDAAAPAAPAAAPAAASEKHLVPWHLRVLAVRLQALGFGEWRRAIMSYYILAEEARAEGAAALAAADDAPAVKRWRLRLQELGVLVASALMEMGDPEAATRHLQSLQQDRHLGEPAATGYLMMECLIWIRLGHLERASDCLSRAHNAPHPGQPRGLSEEDEYAHAIMNALILLCQADAQTCYEEWRFLASKYPKDPLVLHNLAVCSLYVCQLEASREGFEELASEPSVPAFPSLLFNIATLYELKTENSLVLKKALARTVQDNAHEGFIKEYNPIDFKM